jgi:hypothetical protein
VRETKAEELGWSCCYCGLHCLSFVSQLEFEHGKQLQWRGNRCIWFWTIFFASCFASVLEASHQSSESAISFGHCKEARK